MDAIILAGGLGTRLRSVVKELPKVMAPIGGKPFLWYILKQLSAYKIENAILAVGYKSESIIEWVKTQKFPFAIKFSLEEEPLGTGGAIKKAFSLSESEYTLVLNGDSFLDMNFDEFFSAHKNSQKPISIALKPMKNFDRYGNVETDSQGNVISFKEKEFCADGRIGAGCYIISKSAKLFDKFGEKFSMETDILQPLASEHKIGSLICDNYFIDIGIPEDYAKASRDLPERFSLI